MCKAAFTLVEVTVSIFILALVAVVAGVVISYRDSQYDATAAVSAAPAAIDALQAGLDLEDVDELYSAIHAGGVLRLVYRSAGADADKVPWCVCAPAVLPEKPDAEGPVYVAEMGNAVLYKGSSAVEFDVALSWIAPGPAEEAADELRARLDSGKELCSYRVMVLRK